MSWLSEALRAAGKVAKGALGGQPGMGPPGYGGGPTEIPFDISAGAMNPPGGGYGDPVVPQRPGGLPRPDGGQSGGGLTGFMRGMRFGAPEAIQAVGMGLNAYGAFRDDKREQTILEVELEEMERRRRIEQTRARRLRPMADQLSREAGFES